MKFGVLCIVIAMLEKGRGALSPTGNNVCLAEEEYTAVIQVRELIPITVYTVEWCFRVPPRCTVEKQSYRPILVNKHVPRVRIVPKCCQGYEEIPGVGSCGPSCSKPCLHGDCIRPDTCACVSGYHGSRCEKPCEPGTWGRGCLEKCDCSGNGDCEGVNGICNCTAGWIGYRCELPCDPGWYGTNCEGRCNCDGELCNHESGECAAITDTTLANIDNDTTTEEIFFETTTEEITDATDATETVTGYAVTNVTEPTEELEEYTDDDWLIGGNVTTQEASTETESTVTPNIDDVVDREPHEVPVFLRPETSTLLESTPVFPPETSTRQETSPVNETDADNEIDVTYSTDMQKTKSSPLNLLENLSIVCGVFFLIVVLIMCAVLISHYRKMKKVGIDCRKDSNMNSQDFVTHRFYGGCITPVKTVLDIQVPATNLDLDVELPKLMSFKPLPVEKSDKEYFMRATETQEDNFDVANENQLSETILNDDYNNRLAQFEYDVPKSTSFVPAGFKYG